MTAARKVGRPERPVPYRLGRDPALFEVVPRSPAGWIFQMRTNELTVLHAETLDGAEFFAAALEGSPALPIYYGPPGQEIPQ